MKNQTRIWSWHNNDGQVSGVGYDTFEGYFSSIGIVSMVGSISNIGPTKISKIGNRDLVVWDLNFNIVGAVK